MMRKAQVFLRDDQKERLHAVAQRTGRKQSELIRRGVDLALDEADATQTVWREAWSPAQGIWRGRDDVNELLTAIRADMDARIDKLMQ